MITTKKCLALLCAVAMAFSMMAMPVFAADDVALLNGVGYASLNEAVAAAEPGDEITLQADVVEEERIVIEEPISIIGDGSMPKLSGSIAVKLADGEEEPVTISGIEIEHTGVYNSESTLDQKIGLVVQNGGLVATDNYIHLQTPVAENAANSPSAMQLANGKANTANTTYEVSGNTFGYYGQWSTNNKSQAGAVFAALNTSKYGAIDVDAAAIYANNTFEEYEGEGSNFLVSVYDYAAPGYSYAAVGSLVGLENVLGSQNESGLELVVDKAIDGAKDVIVATEIKATTTISYNNTVTDTVVESSADNGEAKVVMPGLVFDAEVDTTEAQAVYYPVIESKGTKVSDETISYTVDITVVKDAAGITSEVPVTDQKVTVTLPSTMTVNEGETVNVYHVTADGNEQIEDVVVNGNEVTFVAPSFSEYIFEIALTALSDSTAEAATTAELVLEEVASESDDFTKVYTIAVKSTDEGKEISRLAAVEFVADFEKNGLPAMCEITGTNDFELSVVGNKYLLNLPEGDDTLLALKSGEQVVIAKVAFSGYTYEGDVVESATLTLSDPVASYDIQGIRGEIAVEGTSFDYANKLASKSLSVKVSYPNPVEANDAEYQDMTVIIQGTNGVYIEENLGTNLLTDEDGTVYYQVDAELPAGGKYTVTVKGAGYRTASKTVVMDRNQIVLFWNNRGAENEVNYLAGDVLMDNIIDVYDLSAVVSYFGEDNLVADHPEYAQYDLNRDGKIDSRDVALVLVSWGY